MGPVTAFSRLYSAALQCDDAGMVRLVKRLWAWLVLVGLGLALAISAVLCSREPLVSEANLQRIKVGMTRAEVIAILGKPTMAISSLSGAPGITASGPEALTYCDSSLLRQNLDE